MERERGRETLCLCLILTCLHVLWQRKPVVTMLNKALDREREREREEDKVGEQERERETVIVSER